MKKIIVFVILFSLIFTSFSFSLEKITHNGQKGYFVTENEMQDLSLFWQLATFYRQACIKIFEFLNEQLAYFLNVELVPGLVNADQTLEALEDKWKILLGE